jgi:hypothetical protein
MNGLPGSGKIGNSIFRRDRQSALTWIPGLRASVHLPLRLQFVNEHEFRASREQKCSAPTVGRSH